MTQAVLRKSSFSNMTKVALYRYNGGEQTKS